MPENSKQNYANHIRHDKAAYTYIFMLLAALIIAVAAIFVENPNVLVTALILNTLATVLLAANSRGYATKLQDRIIRLEMRLRLKDVLGGDTTGRIKDFKLKQLIGLRFASDSELPALSQEVLDKDITDLKQIKQMVKDWQADDLRV